MVGTPDLSIEITISFGRKIQYFDASTIRNPKKEKQLDNREKIHIKSLFLNCAYRLFTLLLRPL